MAFTARGEAARPPAARTIDALLAAEGARTHPYLAGRIFAHRQGHDAARDLADAVHLLVSLHGGSPGVIDLAGRRPLPEGAEDWLRSAAAGFAAERALLMRTVVAAGPLPRTPGQAETEAAIVAQRHAVDMLGRSDRAGCALGAAIALVLDWRTIRMVVDAAARRFGVALVPPALPSPRRTLAAAEAAIDADAAPAFDRAMLFGAQQLLIQHRGLWGLLEARSEARQIAAD